MTPPGPQPIIMEPPPHSPANAPEADGYVINLCSSTTPMALTQPDTPELKRYKFFVSRRLEDGRERFRLHMGHFTTLEEAEELLNVVREIYPGAWAGEAPGKRLRARAAAAAAPAAQPQAAAAPRLTLVATPAAAAVPDPARIPELKPAPAVPARQAAPAVTVKPAAPPARAAAPASARPAASAAAAPVAAVPAAAQPAGSNVREVLAALEDGAARTQVVKAPIAKAPAAESPGISDSQVMRILENRDQPDPDPSISLLPPEDTGTRRMIKEAVARNAPVAFAVQLQFSVQPIDMSKVPPLAIFSAYTLYTVEGSRDGRRWYGLRLGFFSDAISAKQVAHYVRSDFNSVAVVPVSPQERSAAHGADPSAAPPTAAAAPVQPAGDRLAEVDHGFELIDDPPPKPQAAPKAEAPAPAAAKAPAPAKAPTGPKGRKGGPVDARAKRRPQTLEETLEILGADALQFETGKRERLNQAGGRRGAAKPQKNSAFSRLLDRLSERGR